MAEPAKTSMWRDRKIFSWALYDWANSAFAMTVMAGFFPVVFKDYWNAGVEPTLSTLRLANANSIASLCVLVSAPILGAIADQRGARKKFLGTFALTGAIATAAVVFVGEGSWELAAIFYVLGVIGFAGANTFYDSLVVSVADAARVDRVSAFGFALGYLGGGLLFALNVLLVTFPSTFGLSSPLQAVQVSFISVAAWWIVFSVPLLRDVPEPPGLGCDNSIEAVGAAFKQVFHTIQHLRKLKMTLLFLIGYWLYIDGVDTIVKMAVDYGLSIGLDATDLLLALLVTQFVGFPSALAFGVIGERIGAKNGILICIVAYTILTFGAMFVQSAASFYALATSVGLVQGGVQALSRSLYSRMVPPRRVAEFFGFYNMLGKFAAILGPQLIGWVGVLTGSSRIGIVSLVILFVSGGFFLWKVDVEEGQKQALAFDREAP